MNSRITLQHHFSKNITEWLQKDLLKLAEAKIENLENSYFKKFLNKPDAEILITMNIEKNHEEKYDGKFTFTLDGEKKQPYHTNRPFSEPKDVVSHGFSHLKEQLAD